MSPQSSDCLTFIHNLKPSDPSIFFRTPHLTSNKPLDKIRFQGSINIEPVDRAHALINVNWMRVNLPAEDSYYLAEIKDGMIVATHGGATYLESSEPLSEIKEKLILLDSPIPVGFDEFNNTILFKGAEYSEFE